MTDDDHLPTDHLPTDRVTSGPLLGLHDELVEAARRRSSAESDQGRPRSVTVQERPAPGRRHRSQSLVPLVAAAATAIVVGVGIVGYTVAGSTDAAAGVAIEHTGDFVTVSLSGDVTIDEIRDALEDADVEVSVEPRKTGPSLVDRFVGVGATDSARLVGGDGRSSATATFPAGSTAQLMLGVAAGGESYEVPTDPTEPGEPLEGLTISGVPVAEFRTDLGRLTSTGSVTVMYQSAEGAPVADPTDDAVIAEGTALSPELVLITLR